MKKHFTLIFTLFLILLQISASAQGEWKWANYWSGNGDDVSSVTKTAFDKEGNIYVFGQIGGSLSANGQGLHFTNSPQVLSLNKRGAMLAKFDSLGNMLWYKVVKSSESWDCFPYWMEVKNGKVYISGDLSIDYVDYYGASSVWAYYLDTLITGPQVQAIPVEQRRPPYKTGRYTYFATFDLDGNLLENHFVETFSREIYSNGIRAAHGLCLPSIGNAPFHVDNEGNVFVFTMIYYGGNSSDPYTIIVDGDTNKRYDIYLPLNLEPTDLSFHTGMMYKFSPDWELVYGKPMVDHTEGIATSWELLQDSVHPRYMFYINGMSFDEDDNMYITGDICLDLFGDFGGDLHQYPIKIYWDSIHYATIQDITSSDVMSFVLKYNTNGNIIWDNQIYTRGNISFSALASWTGVNIYDGAVYILGNGGYDESENGLVYFDNEDNPLQRYQQSTLYQTFFVRYNAQTGQYLNHGIVPAKHVACGKFPSSKNNRVFAFARSFQDSKDMICVWGKDGTFIQEIDVPYGLKRHSVLADERGHILFDAVSQNPVTFDNNVSADCPSGQSSAVFALYYDPSFAEPYVGIPQYGETVSNLKIWPNPANSVLNIESDNSSIDQIVITDLNGKMLLQETVGDNHKQIDISQLPAGIYLLKAVRNGEASIGKFAKTNN